MNEETRSMIVDTYRSANPTIETSKAIVEDIAIHHGLKTASVRAVLVKAGIYVAQPRRRDTIDPRDEGTLRLIFREATALERSDVLWPNTVGKQLNYQSHAVYEFFFKLKQEEKRIRQIEEQTARQSSRSSSAFFTIRSQSPDNQYGVLQGAANLIGLLTSLGGIALLIFVVVALISAWISLFQ